MKIDIVGARREGLAMVARHLIDELVPDGPTHDAASGGTMDMHHAKASGNGTDVRLGHVGGDSEDAAGSDMIFIRFGARDLGWERATEADAEFAELKPAIPLLVAPSPNATFLLAMNAVGAMRRSWAGLASQRAPA